MRADSPKESLIERPPGVYFDWVAPKAETPRRRTDIAGFAGVLLPPDAPRAKAPEGRLCNRLEDFLDLGKPPASGYLGAAVRGFFANGGRTCFVAPIYVELTPPVRALALEDEGPPAALVLNLEHFTNREQTGALDYLAKNDSVSLIAAPDAYLIPADKGGADPVHAALIAQAEQLGDRVAILDLPADYGRTANGFRLSRSEFGFAAAYWPWIEVANDERAPGDRFTRAVPPSGHVAGTIARRDIEQGVFAPPANMLIEGALDVVRRLSVAERLQANRDGVNAICALPGRGVRTMGARLWGGGESRWLHVRRTLIYLSGAIEDDTLWTMFEPHTEALWRALERLTRTILFDLWRRGGLAGATDDEAYVVRCDATINPASEVGLGRVVCEIALRFPDPAEVIFVRIAVAEGHVEFVNQEVIRG